MVADWGRAAGALAVRFLEPSPPASLFRVVGEARAPREGLVAVPLLRLPGGRARDGRRGGGGGRLGRDQRPAGQGSRPGRRLGPGRAGGRARRALAGGLPLPPPGRQGGARAGGTVARYTPQAVLVANVEEARYQALLVRRRQGAGARALRRAQQPAQLPGPRACPRRRVLWSASVSGKASAARAARPKARCCCRSRRAAPARRPPPSRWRSSTSSARRPGPARASAQVTLPALDLPVSRTGLVLHHSPRFKVDARHGRVPRGGLRRPLSPALRRAAGNAPPPPTPPERGDADARSRRRPAGAATGQQLVERFQKGRVARVRARCRAGAVSLGGPVGVPGVRADGRRAGPVDRTTPTRGRRSEDAPRRAGAAALWPSPCPPSPRRGRRRPRRARSRCRWPTTTGWWSGPPTRPSRPRRRRCRRCWPGPTLRMQGRGSDVRGTHHARRRGVAQRAHAHPAAGRLHGARRAPGRQAAASRERRRPDRARWSAARAPSPSMLEWGTPITQEPGQASFVLPTPAAGSVRVTLDVPGRRRRRARAARPGDATSAAGGRTLVEATLDPGSRPASRGRPARARLPPPASRASSPT